MDEERKARRAALRETVRVYSSHEEADAADREYYLSLTVEERQRIALELRRRAWPGPNPDIKEYERSK